MRDRQGVATIMLMLSLVVLSIIPAIQAADAPTLTRVGALKLYPGENYLTPSVIDHGAGFAYFVTHDYFRTQNVVVKVRLSDFTRVGSLVLDVTDDVLSAVIDSAGGFIYFGTYGTAIVRVRLSDFTQVDSLRLNPGESYLSTAVIDPSAGYAYFGAGAWSWTNGGTIIKVSLSDFTEVGFLTLNPGESGLISSAIDPAAGFAYFGAANSRVVVKVKLSDFTRVASAPLSVGNYPTSAVIDPAGGFVYFGMYENVITRVRLLDFSSNATSDILTLNPGENGLWSAVIDSAAGFAYFGTRDTNPSVVVKVRLSDFTEVGSLTLNSGESSLLSAVIDPTAGFGYFGATSYTTSPGSIVKVWLSSLTRVGALTLKPTESLSPAAVIDSTGNFAYFGTSPAQGPGGIVKVRLSDLTLVATLSLNPGEFPLSAVIDSSAGFAYFGTCLANSLSACFGTGTSSSVIVKIRLSNLTRTGSLSLNAGESVLFSSVIDPAAGFAYFGTISRTVLKIRLSDLTRVGSLTLNPSEGPPWSAVIDPEAGFAYFGTGAYPNPGVIVKVRLMDFTEVESLTLNRGEITPFSAVIDPAAGLAYFGTGSALGIIVKVKVGTAAPFDYSLSNSGGVSVRQGGSGTNAITVALSSGTAQTVALSCAASTLPSGASCSFDPPSVTPTGSSVLTISTTSATPTGAFQVKATGSPLGTSATSTTFTLTVIPPPPVVSTPSATPSIIDSGQSSTLSATFSGGASPYTCQWLQEAPGASSFSGFSGSSSCISPVSTLTGVLNTVGTWSFELQVIDSSGSPLISSAVTVTVNDALTPPVISVSTTTIDSGQSSTLSTATSFGGGTSTYTCQWMQKAPGAGSYSSLGGSFSCNTGDDPIVSTGTLTTAGAWSFKLQVTDASGSPVAVTSNEVTLTVNTPPVSWILLAGAVGVLVVAGVIGTYLYRRNFRARRVKP